MMSTIPPSGGTIDLIKYLLVERCSKKTMISSIVVAEVIIYQNVDFFGNDLYTII
jgi:hypothetical protein